jgi:cytoskeletal protein CcmA (bactofilin family)
MALLTMVTAPAWGAEYKAGETVAIPAGEALAGDLFAGARQVHIQGRVEGDVYAGCEQLLIEGDVSQDVHAGCRSLILKGRVGDDVIFFGEKLLIEGEISGDVTAFGARVFLSPTAVIHGDLFVAAGEIELDGGSIKGNLKGHVDSAFLNGTIEKNTSLDVGEISYGPDSHTLGETQLTLCEPLDRDRAGLVPDNADIVVKEREHSSPFGSIFGMLWSMAAAFIVGLVFVLFFKNTTRDFLDFAKSRTLANTGLGLVYLVVIPVAVVILFLLILTIPAALMVTGLYLIALYISGILASLSLAERLMDRMGRASTTRNLILPLVIGVVVVKLITAIPFFIGCLIGLAVICYGLGSLFNFIWHLRKTPEAYAEA